MEEASAMDVQPLEPGHAPSDSAPRQDGPIPDAQLFGSESEATDAAVATAERARSPTPATGPPADDIHEEPQQASVSQADTAEPTQDAPGPSATADESKDVAAPELTALPGHTPQPGPSADEGNMLQAAGAEDHAEPATEDAPASMDGVQHASDTAATAQVEVVEVIAEVEADAGPAADATEDAQPAYIPLMDDEPELDYSQDLPSSEFTEDESDAGDDAQEQDQDQAQAPDQEQQPVEDMSPGAETSALGSVSPDAAAAGQTRRRKRSPIRFTKPPSAAEKDRQPKKSEKFGEGGDDDQGQNMDGGVGGKAEDGAAGAAGGKHQAPVTLAVTAKSKGSDKGKAAEKEKGKGTAVGSRVLQGGAGTSAVADARRRQAETGGREHELRELPPGRARGSMVLMAGGRGPLPDHPLLRRPLLPDPRMDPSSRRLSLPEPRMLEPMRRQVLLDPRGLPPEPMRPLPPMLGSPGRMRGPWPGDLPPPPMLGRPGTAPMLHPRHMEELARRERELRFQEELRREEAARRVDLIRREEAERARRLELARREEAERRARMEREELERRRLEEERRARMEREERARREREERARREREEAERRARVERERRAREAERKEREEREQRAREAERKARQEREERARKEEAERRAREEKARREREEAARRPLPAGRDDRGRVSGRDLDVRSVRDVRDARSAGPAPVARSEPMVRSGAGPPGPALLPGPHRSAGLPPGAMPLLPMDRLLPHQDPRGLSGPPGPHARMDNQSQRDSRSSAVSGSQHPAAALPGPAPMNSPAMAAARQQPLMPQGRVGLGGPLAGGPSGSRDPMAGGGPAAARMDDRGRVGFGPGQDAGPRGGMGGGPPPMERVPPGGVGPPRMGGPGPMARSGGPPDVWERDGPPMRGGPPMRDGRRGRELSPPRGGLWPGPGDLGPMKRPRLEDVMPPIRPEPGWGPGGRDGPLGGGGGMRDGPMGGGGMRDGRMGGGGMRDGPMGGGGPDPWRHGDMGGRSHGMGDRDRPTGFSGGPGPGMSDGFHRAPGGMQSGMPMQQQAAHPQRRDASPMRHSAPGMHAQPMGHQAPLHTCQQLQSQPQQQPAAQHAALRQQMPAVQLPAGFHMPAAAQAAAPTRHRCDPDAVVWFYMDPEGSQQGPCSINQFRAWIRTMQASPSLAQPLAQFESAMTWSAQDARRRPLKAVLAENS